MTERSGGMAIPSTDLFGIWQPICDAPKDRVLIGWCEEWGEPMTIDWDKRHEQWMGPCAHFQPFDQPTHWMPLPLPPNIIVDRISNNRYYCICLVQYCLFLYSSLIH